jgi:hypothetical protein
MRIIRWWSKAFAQIAFYRLFASNAAPFWIQSVMFFDEIGRGHHHLHADNLQANAFKSADDLPH